MKISDAAIAICVAYFRPRLCNGCPIRTACESGRKGENPDDWRARVNAAADTTR